MVSFVTAYDVSPAHPPFRADAGVERNGKMSLR